MVSQATSLFTWMEIQPTIGLKQLRVMDAMRQLGTASNVELAVHLGWPINTVTPRVHELRGLTRNKKTGLPLIWPARIGEHSTRACKITGRTVKVWHVIEQKL